MLKYRTTGILEISRGTKMASINDHAMLGLLNDLACAN
jgi:hypothetical protein